MERPLPRLWTLRAWPTRSIACSSIRACTARSCRSRRGGTSSRASCSPGATRSGSRRPARWRARGPVRLAAAGGLVRGGGSGALNLARLVVDGEQIGEGSYAVLSARKLSLFDTRKQRRAVWDLALLASTKLAREIAAKRAALHREQLLERLATFGLGALGARRRGGGPGDTRRRLRGSARSSAARVCMRAGISSEKNSMKSCGIRRPVPGNPELRRFPWAAL